MPPLPSLSGSALWPPSPRREAPHVYFLRRLSPGAALARYGALAAAGVGAGMLVEQWIKKKVAEDGGMIVLLPKKAPQSEEAVPDAK
eukprot:SM000189S04111  [mRNA]  locus=s189:105678:106256:- [translate_table: standard]